MLKKISALIVSLLLLITTTLAFPIHSSADAPYSLWPTTTTPSTPAENDTSAVEVGTKFKSDINGQVTAIKFYKGTGNTGTHVGHLWTAGGDLLGTVTFTNETTTGWQTANLSTPVAITANTTYVVSYHAPNGRYSVNEAYFTTGYDNAPLHALSTGVGNGNGVYKYGSSGSFPTDTYNASNYWVDVVVEPEATPTPTATPTPAANTKKAILVVTTESNQFTKYYPEILKAEGLNAYETADLTSVSASTLNQYDVVILGETALNATQVSMFSTWVTNGGNLVAMRPDKQLASLFGITDASSTLADKYLLVNTSAGPGKGIVNQTIQFHGTADVYTINGATSVATLYSDATTATSNPAVTIKTVGSNGGEAVAFTYDLAKSVVLTHQGNPAWAGQERDGDSTIRPHELFYPDYVDLNKVQIPQADEQQRLLANIITQINLDNKPMPRFWYLPNGEKAALVYTLDDHNTATGTKDVFNKLAANSVANCSVADWECYRGTSWFFPGVNLNNTEAAAYNTQGFEMGTHVENNGCTNFTSLAQLNSIFDSSLASFAQAYPSLPAQQTHRFHCIVWSDWNSQAKANLAHGIRYNMDYYYWPPAWVNGRPGLFTGSGIPMKYTDTDGTLVDVYQAPSHLVNENGINYDTAVTTLVANATGTKGYYGIFGTHDDYRDTTFSDSIINAANAYNVPIVSAKQVLTWLDGRNNSSFNTFSWNGTTLNFTVAVGSNTNGIQAMLPVVTSTNSALNGLTRNGSPVTYTTQTIKGISYAFFPAAAGDYVATYNGVVPTATPTPAFTTHSLWDASVVPAIPSANDTSAVEVGTKFRSDIDGQITAIRFYKGSANTGSHVGHLWTAGGQLLATVTFANETASGWQEATLSTPVAVTANTTYVVSYHAPNGGYSATASYFTTDYNNAPLHGPSSATSGGNGVFSYGSAGTFPTSSFNANSYWVDVVFQTIPVNTPTPTVAPTATVTPTPAVTSHSLWTNATVPANPSVNDPSAVEIGTKFRADQDGQITAIKFYKGTNNTGTHVGHLWTSGGQLLATVTFANETTTGWQEATLSTPVAVTANTTYVVSYHAPNGNYAANSAYFATDYDNAPLHALAAGGNGVYAYGTSGTFPSSSYNATNYWVDVVYQTGAAPTATPTPTSGPTATPTVTPTPGQTVSIWPNTTVPANPNDPDNAAVSLGVKFRSDVSGQVKGIRFYKGTNNTGTHIGSLWSENGTRLATVTFSNETASGWQEALFSTPVTITANTTYVASYFAPNGHYAGDNNYFATAFDNAPLHALSSGSSSGNGVYIYGSDAFPTNSYQASNYWVDVVFQQ